MEKQSVRTAGNRLSLAAIMAQKEDPVNSQRLVIDFRATLGKSRPTPPQPRRSSLWAIIEAKDASILAPSRRPAIGVEMDPEIGYL